MTSEARRASAAGGGTPAGHGRPPDSRGGSDGGEGHGRLTRGATLLHASGNGAPHVRSERRPPRRGRGVPETKDSQARRREAGRGERRPGRLSCPEPGGLCPRRPRPAAPDAAAASQSVSHMPRTPPRDPACPPPTGAAGHGGAPPPQRPGTGSDFGAAHGRPPTPAAAMMDYEPLHNEARPRPRPRPRRRPEPASRGPGCPRRRFPGTPAHLLALASVPRGSPARDDLLKATFPSAR